MLRVPTIRYSIDDLTAMRFPGINTPRKQGRNAAPMTSEGLDPHQDLDTDRFESINLVSESQSSLLGV